MIVVCLLNVQQQQQQQLKLKIDFFSKNMKIVWSLVKEK